MVKSFDLRDYSYNATKSCRIGFFLVKKSIGSFLSDFRAGAFHFEGTVQQLTVYLTVLFATQLVLHLYGAGLRRPFGSVATIENLPRWLRRTGGLVLVADLLVVVYVIAMWCLVIRQLGVVTALVAGVAFSLISDRLTYLTPLVRFILGHNGVANAGRS
ncbi:MAG: hypothetical protein AB7E67_12930 [Xanthobacteraceae bacterium]